ncbi:MAG: peptide ligase PGM1-related protein [Acidimicrobiales bacterium]
MLAQRLGASAPVDLEAGTFVVLPSATFPVAELRKITGIGFYEERMLFTTLYLRRPGVRLVYLTSVPVDEAVVDYYLRHLADPAGARRRLTLVTLDQSGPLALSDKLVDRPDVLARVREAVGDPDDAFLLPFNVTPAEQAVSDALGLALYGARPELARLGSKTGARQVARRAGVPVLTGAEDLHTLAEVEAAIRDIEARRPGAVAVVVKLNDGFSGQGNAIVELGGPGGGNVVERPTTFCAAGESWPSFAAKLAAGGGIVEELVRQPGVRSPSTQVHIAASGRVEVISTHDQVLGGPQDQVYLGCRFPADRRYRAVISEQAGAVAAVLAGEGVIGSFGIDWVVRPTPSGDEVTLSEINLRLGGTTHPYWMCRLATGAAYDPAAGELTVAGGGTRAYRASDNLTSARLRGATPAGVIAAVERSGLAFDPATGTGAFLHLLGAVPEFGKMGVTCVAPDPASAQALYDDVVALLDG